MSNPHVQHSPVPAPNVSPASGHRNLTLPQVTAEFTPTVVLTERQLGVMLRSLDELREHTGLDLWQVDLRSALLHTQRALTSQRLSQQVASPDAQSVHWCPSCGDPHGGLQPTCQDCRERR